MATAEATDKLMEFFRYAGISGIAIVGLTILLALTWLLVLSSKPSRRALLAVAGFSVLPLLIGLAGTAIGRAQTRSSIEAAALYDPQEADALIAQGYRQANSVAYAGLAATFMLWCACGIAVPFVRRQTPAPDSN